MIPASAITRTILYVAETVGEPAARQMSYQFGKVISKEMAKVVFEAYKIEDPMERLVHGPLTFCRFRSRFCGDTLDGYGS